MEAGVTEAGEKVVAVTGEEMAEVAKEVVMEEAEKVEVVTVAEAKEEVRGGRWRGGGGDGGGEGGGGEVAEKVAGDEVEMVVVVKEVERAVERWR